jgi:hypothetical protein
MAQIWRRIALRGTAAVPSARRFLLHSKSFAPNSIPPTARKIESPWPIKGAGTALALGRTSQLPVFGPVQLLSGTVPKDIPAKRS